MAGELANICGEEERPLIIALPPLHDLASQLAALARDLRGAHRAAGTPEMVALSRSLNVSETIYGNHASTYLIMPGTATSEEAITAYQHIRRTYPGVLDLLCMAASRGAAELTIEVGTLSRRDQVAYSQHDLMRIMPRILANFRGVPPQT